MKAKDWMHMSPALISATVLTFTVCCMVGLGEGVSTSLLTTFLLESRLNSGDL